MDNPVKKRKLAFGENTCCFCSKTFENNKTVLDPKQSAFLLSACRTRSDELSVHIIENEEKIKLGDIKLSYHKNCRTKFLYSKRHGETQTEQDVAGPSKLLRSNTNDAFNWKEMCFICDERCCSNHRKTWSQIQGSVDETSSLYTKLLAISAACGDDSLHSRLLSSKGDLVAVEARYHRKKGCLAKYLLKNQNQIEPEPVPINPLQHLCEQLKVDLQESIEIEKKVYEVSELKTRLTQIANLHSKTISSNQMTGKTIKSMLKRVWPELKFISRTGLSYLVCSESLTINEALCKIVKSEKCLEEAEEQTDLENSLCENFENSEENEISVIHKAAVILKKRLCKANSLQNEYYSTSEISPDVQVQNLDPLLLKFVRWLSGDTDDINANDTLVGQRVLTLCSDITYLVKPVLTPKHLGLSVYLHHTYGSKKLIEDLHCHGYTLPYSEVRHFLTSAAVHMSSVQSQTPSGGLVPSQLKRTTPSEDRHRVGDLIVAAADNWDHNENTLSGKHSTHAMTSILMQTASGEMESNRIPRQPERSIDVSSLPGRGLAHTLNYERPTQRPSPVLDPPLKPDELNQPPPEQARLLRLKEIMYTIGRHKLLSVCDDRAVRDTAFPPWTVFQTHVQDDNVSDTIHVAFNPIILAPPNDYNTVYTTLKRTKEQMYALGQDVCPIVFDMGLLSKALEIVWAKPEEFAGVYPLEGGMHFMMCLFGGIGHVYGEAGLKQLLTESDVFAAKTTEHILSGKDFDRALRGLIMVDEVLNQRFITHFFKWLEERSDSVHSEIVETIVRLNKESVKNKEELKILLEALETQLLPHIEEFRTEGRVCSPNFRFWDDYLSEVSLPMKLYLAASRHGLWHAHQYAKSKLLPFLFSSNRSVYSRFMPYLVLQNHRLPEDLLKQFEDGKFVAKLTPGLFNAVWYDYILEVTENKALKSSGGIIGITHNENALNRWFLARPVTAKYAMAYSSNKSQNSTKHHSDTQYHVQSYNKYVGNMVDLFESGTFIDPFSLSDPPSRLLNFASGVEMTPDVEASLLGVHQSGKISLDKFVTSRLGPSPTKGFYDTLPKSKTMTCGSAKPKAKSKCSTVPLNGEQVCYRLLAINAFKKVPLERIMSFENSPVPLSMFTDDGSLMSTKKSDFLEKIESFIDPESYSLTASSTVGCFLYDAMAVVQMLQPPTEKTTYGMMASLFWTYILAHRQGAFQVHVVFDQYIENSLKTQTRLKRGENISSIGPVSLHPKMVVNDWKKVLSSTRSKKELTRLLTKYLTENCHTLLDDGTTVYISGGMEEIAVKCTPTAVEYVQALESNHEEADSRLILHVAHAASLGVKHCVVFSPDTDVFVLLVNHFSCLMMTEIFFKTGRRSINRDLTRYVPIHTVADTLSPELIRIMLSVYCLTGCDTSSSFHGIGKKKNIQVMCKAAGELSDLADLGTNPSLTEKEKTAALKFVGLLYGYSNCSSLNSIRASHARRNTVRPRKMPPTNDSFLLHLLRCTYQLFIWRAALNPKISFLEPLDFGYEKSIGTNLYTPKLMDQAMAAPELLSDLVCSCVDLCSEECVCSNNEQPCTKACACEGTIVEPICENNRRRLVQATQHKTYTHISCKSQAYTYNHTHCITRTSTTCS